MSKIGKERVQQAFLLINKISNDDMLYKLINTLFDYALEDRDAAEELLSKENKFVANFIKAGITQEQLLKFSSLYPDLTEKLITNAHLSNEMATALRHEAGTNNSAETAKAVASQIDTVYDGRTQLALQKPNIQKQGNDLFININDKKYPIVTRNVRNFNQKIYSVGSTESRENLELDPNSPLLQAKYQQLVDIIKSLGPNATTIDIINATATMTQNCFPNNNLYDLNELIKANILGGGIISLDTFITHGIGVCRHHTLLNSYFLSRLNEDKIINGEVIHHRQDIIQKDIIGAHAWNIFIDNNTHKLYSLDSLWQEIHCVTDNPGCLNSYPNAEKIISERYLQSLQAAASSAEIKTILADLRNAKIFDDDPKNFKNSPK